MTQIETPVCCGGALGATGALGCPRVVLAFPDQDELSVTPHHFNPSLPHKTGVPGACQCIHARDHEAAR